MTERLSTETHSTGSTVTQVIDAAAKHCLERCRYRQQYEREAGEPTSMTPDECFQIGAESKITLPGMQLCGLALAAITKEAREGAL